MKPYLRREGYFLFCPFFADGETKLNMVMQLALLGDCEAAPVFKQFDDAAPNINDVLIFDTRGQARHVIKRIRAELPQFKIFIAIRKRHPVGQFFIPQWTNYGRWLWLNKIYTKINTRVQVWKSK